MSQTEQNPTTTALLKLATQDCAAGIGSVDRLEIKWQILASTGDIVEQVCQAG